jgi:hypothetical protein
MTTIYRCLVNKNAVVVEIYPVAEKETNKEGKEGK